jgi:hypothetical protein
MSRLHAGMAVADAGTIRRRSAIDMRLNGWRADDASTGGHYAAPGRVNGLARRFQALLLRASPRVLPNRGARMPYAPSDHERKLPPCFPAIMDNAVIPIPPAQRLLSALRLQQRDGVSAQHQAGPDQTETFFDVGASARERFRARPSLSAGLQRYPSGTIVRACGVRESCSLRWQRAVV